MGRDWLHKATRGEDGSGHKGVARKYSNTSSPGCMSAIYNLFDIQNHQFRLGHSTFLSETAFNDFQHSNHFLQGIEAPRNSLEWPEPATNRVSSSSLDSEARKNLNIPVDRIQIETKPSRFIGDLSSECINSPGTKTPNLIARLMGLDMLPEHSSPRPSSSSHYERSRSLPATPRLSTDNNEYHHRLSLQIDKENCDHRCSSQHVKQISNRGKERIGRRLGIDITNTMSPARSKHQRRDSDLDVVKPKRGESKRLSSSTKALKLLDVKSNLNKPFSNAHTTSIKKVKIKSEIPKFLQTTPMKQVKDEKVKKIASEKHDLGLKKMNQQHKMVVSKNKSTALANNKMFGTLNKDMASSSSIKKTLPQKQQVSLPIDLKSLYNSNDTYNLKPSTTITTTNTNTNNDDNDDDDNNNYSFSNLSNYISTILYYCGIHSTTPISCGQWHSFSHPIHPSIFHKLEKLPQPATAMTRRMIFDLVDELLVEILKPYMTPKLPYSCVMCGSDLIRELCARIRSCSASEGKVFERLLTTTFEAEVEDIVMEIEGEILVNMVHEIAIVVTCMLR
ncbi:hypothetical protein QVD17_07420 [Tagetes erecta]|uniref:DUF3741 domain-containing protein n=1 Tax=Tagetes erecta TaxID=13708 RepID=A0AAD8LQ71_TARER|nr:hypothetical protein QVD17_07420 [Tagetes erecta]